MLYDARCPKCRYADEIDKPASAPFPKCPLCGARMEKAYTQPVPVHYAAAGFYSTDVGRMRAAVGPALADKFEHEKTEYFLRESRNRLTPQEKALERRLRQTRSETLAKRGKDEVSKP